MADTSYKSAFNRGVLRRYKIATSKTPRMTARALRMRRMKDAVQKAKQAKARARKLGIAKRFRERLAKVNKVASNARAKSAAFRRQMKAAKKVGSAMRARTTKSGSSSGDSPGNG